MQTFEKLLLQNYLTEFLDILRYCTQIVLGYVQLKFVQMDCTNYLSMDIFEFLDLKEISKEISKFSTDHLKITSFNQYHAIAALK